MFFFFETFFFAEKFVFRRNTFFSPKKMKTPAFAGPGSMGNGPGPSPGGKGRAFPLPSPASAAPSTGKPPNLSPRRRVSPPAPHLLPLGASGGTLNHSFRWRTPQNQLLQKPEATESAHNSRHPRPPKGTSKGERWMGENSYFLQQLKFFGPPWVLCFMRNGIA